MNQFDMIVAETQVIVFNNLSTAEKAEREAYTAKMDYIKDLVLFGFTLTYEEKRDLSMWDIDWFREYKHLIN